MRAFGNCEASNVSQNHRATAIQVWALVTLSRQSDSQCGDVSEQDELRDSQQGEALEIFQAEVTFPPGEVPFDGGAGCNHQALPLFQKEEGCQFTLASAPQVVVNSRMGLQDIVDDFEHFAIKVSGIGKHDQHPKPVQDGGKQDNEPTDLGVMHMSRRDQNKHRQIRLMTQDRMHLVAEERLLTRIFLSSGVGIVSVPGSQQGRIDDQFLAGDDTFRVLLPAGR